MFPRKRKLIVNFCSSIAIVRDAFLTTVPTTVSHYCFLVDYFSIVFLLFPFLPSHNCVERLFFLLFFLIRTQVGNWFVYVLTWREIFVHEVMFIAFFSCWFWHHGERHRSVWRGRQRQPLSRGPSTSIFNSDQFRIVCLLLFVVCFSCTPKLEHNSIDFRKLRLQIFTCENEFS